MTVATLAERWNVALERRLEGSTCSEVWAGTWRGRRVALKLPEPESEERLSLPVLRAFSRAGGVDVLEGDEASGACLMPLLGPTIAASGLSDAEMTAEFCRVGGALRQVSPTAGMAYADYAQDALATNAPGMQEAIRMLHQLIESSGRETLTHGDLHHFNLLQGENGGEGGYVAIDPKGVRADPCSEVVAWVRNPTPIRLTPEQVATRLRLIAEHWGDPYDRLWAWAWAGNTVSEFWDKRPDETPNLAAIRAARTG